MRAGQSRASGQATNVRLSSFRQWYLLTIHPPVRTVGVTLRDQNWSGVSVELPGGTRYPRCLLGDHYGSGKEMASYGARILGALVPDLRPEGYYAIPPLFMMPSAIALNGDVTVRDTLQGCASAGDNIT